MNTSCPVVFSLVGALVFLSVAGSPSRSSAAEPAQLTIQADQRQSTISPMIYGHFSEHLGRCIYEGFWVGEDSPIPNTRGIRNDVVEALRGIKAPSEERR